MRPLLCLCLALFAASPLLAQREKLPPEDLEIVEQRWPEAKKTFTGLRYIVLKAGDPAAGMPKTGMKVSVVYKGMLLDGKIFDQNTAENPLKVRIDRGDLIEGWEEALQKMTKGEKWLLIVPPELAYGAKGRPPGIKRYATLVFEMELLDFGKDLK
ncbi:FKBP-type peptidyl-prolyl cis-trans isomerase FkpA precursor [Lacunisphaera limnophila]|uniref:Peptidyl-prolyl cis-trans isomerase n=1 Tax=Lacunisphaera limnophila TaxID=1838286 RepID=A0A1D8ASM3_9BACT|nr:FKBP-type peptidyl-prolyl cis-trans isomerase [Lacunisphaera limnophila]AOS43898.1 FKBP-type peptidyl-prolyl cis-trans isomerase FkpA precursor [Lacunisphaera limnophila]